MPLEKDPVYAVIMAGGVGSRFWPQSRRHHPKQFLPILSSRSMIEETCLRLRPLVPWDRIFVVAGEEHASEVSRLLPALPPDNLLLEPYGRGTAPCIGFAALHIQDRSPGALMVVLPADHAIGRPRAFRQALRVAISMAREPFYLVALGVAPTRPETGYGYIRVGAKLKGQRGKFRLFEVRSFHEKPSLQKARRFLASGEYLWNSGIFVFRAETLLRALGEFLPLVHKGLTHAFRSMKGGSKRALRRVYRQLPSISIDRGVMEKVGPKSHLTGGLGEGKDSLRLAVVAGDFGWSDVGSWDALAAFWKKDRRGNAIRARAVLVDTDRAVVFSPSRLMALLGVRDIIVVDTEDAVLVCHSSQAQDVRRVVEILAQRGWHHYL